MYEIQIEWSNHIAGYDSETYKTRYTNLETARRKLVELALDDDRLLEDNSRCVISKDIRHAMVYDGSREGDFCEYYINTIPKMDVCVDKSKKLTEKELKELIDERLDGEEIIIEIGDV